MVLEKAATIVRTHPDWPLLAIPDKFAGAYDLSTEVREQLSSGSLLFFAAADVIDDAQDGDLDSATWGDPPWLRGCNVGTCLLFASIATFMQVGFGARAFQAAKALAAAGLRMTAGQHLDFELGPTGSAFDEQAYLECIEGKSGGSLGLFCELVGLAAARLEPEIESLRVFGQWAGASMQIVSDVGEIWSPAPSRDLIQGRRTLPVLFAISMLKSESRTEFLHLVANPTRKTDIVAQLDEIGAGPYCQIRLNSYLSQGRAILSALSLPDSAKADLAAILDDLEAYRPLSAI